MSTPINLNKARKARARRDKQARADENAVKFGRTKAQKTREAAIKECQTRAIDAHKREK